MRRLVGRDVLGAPRAGNAHAARRGRPRCTHGDVPGTRAAEDVGPYHKCPRDRHAPVPPRRGNGMRRLVGRDVLGAPRAGGRARGRPGGRGPPGTSAPTTNVPVAAMRPCRPGGGTGCAAGRARRPRRAARTGTRTLRAGDAHPARRGTSMRAWGRPGGRGPPGTSAPTMRYQANAWLFQKFPCIRRVPYRGNVQRESNPLRESHPLSDILAFYRMSPTFPMLSVCSVAAKPFCVFCAVVARHAGRRNHISLCPNLRMRSICVP